MKKITKISALVIAVTLMCLSFTGCAELDKMKEQQAFWTEKGSKNSITYDGAEYIAIDNPDSYNPTYNSNEDFIYVTDADVPVLLSSDFGVSLQISNDKNFIFGFAYDVIVRSVNEEYDELKDHNYGPFSDTSEGKEILYCKKDIYDEVKEKFEKGINYTGYGYRSWMENPDENGNAPYYYLDDKDAKLIDKIADEVKPEIQNDAGVSYSGCNICTLNSISEDKYFGKLSYDVIWADDVDEYYLSLYTFETETYSVYKVPKEYNSDFDRIFKNAIDAWFGDTE